MIAEDSMKINISVGLRKIIEKFWKILISELLMELSLKWAIDHKIKIIWGSKFPSKALYRLNQIELVELKKQLDKLLVRICIWTNKSSYRTSIFFAKKNK